MGNEQMMGVSIRGGMFPGTGGAQGGVMAVSLGGVVIRHDVAGNFVGGASVLGPVDGQNPSVGHPNGGMLVPVLPEVQRNNVSRLRFLMEILPKLMHITNETTPVETREVLLRRYGTEVHLQQCWRAKTEILKNQATENEDREESTGQQQTHHHSPRPQHSKPNSLRQQQIEEIDNESANESNQQLFGDMSSIPNASPRPFTLHSPSALVPPSVSDRSSATMMTVGEAPVRCPYCINLRWMGSIKDNVRGIARPLGVL